MPFTLSHAAAAWPFRRTRLDPSALVMGCFAPDFEYFIPFGPHNRFGHTLTGVFAFDLPAAFAVLWLFHRYAKEPLAACLPEGPRERLHLGPRTLSISTFSRFAMILFSILVGIATHIFWDSFTHPDSWFSDHWSWLRMTVSVPLFGPRLCYAILEYVSSLLGLVVILLWWLHWYRRSPPVRSRTDPRFLMEDRIALSFAFVIALAAGFTRAASSGLPNGVHGSQRFMADFAVTSITVFWIEVLAYGIIRKAIRNTRAQGSAASQ